MNVFQLMHYIGRITPLDGWHLSYCIQCATSAPNVRHFSPHYVITACAVATSRCIRDVPFQWEKRNFDPHNSHIFLPIFLKLKTKKHDIQETDLYQGEGTSGRTPNFWPYFRGYPYLFIYLLYSSLSVSVVPRVVRRPMRAQNVFPAKEVPSGGLNNEK